jgi:hypothetical protein
VLSPLQWHAELPLLNTHLDIGCHTATVEALFACQRCKCGMPVCAIHKQKLQRRLGNNTSMCLQTYEKRTEADGQVTDNMH